MKLMRIGVDVAKQVFQVHGVDRHEQPAWRRRLSRERWLKAVSETAEPGCEIGMEACGGAHHWARQLQAMGYRVKLIAPQFVKPYVKSNKNDANDAEATCEAMSRPSMRLVSVKSLAQQDLQAIHRVRASLVEQRTAKGNQVRGLVAEYGLVAPREISSLRRAIPCWLEDADNGLSAFFRDVLEGLWRDLQTAASLGLTPRQHSSGGRERLLGISKRGDAYVRSLLVHGARAMLRTAPRHDDPLSRWVTRLSSRSHPNVACVAMANKTARMAWAMLRHGTNYQTALAAA